MTRESITFSNPASPDSIVGGPTAISFGHKLATSGLFKALFADGMALVENTAAYLDGEGRDEARRMARAPALAYASESMRLTTRLMQIAAWLLLQRAINEGEMTEAEAAADKNRTRAAWPKKAPDHEVDATLPAELAGLVEASLHVQARIVRLDALMNNAAPVSAGVPASLAMQRSRLQEAFCD